MKHVPNALTLLRLVLAPVIAWLLWSTGAAPGADTLAGIPLRLTGIANTLTLAAILFVVAALTDLFDGMIARAYNAHSKFGRIIDPIADKALVGLPLIVIAIMSAGSAEGLFIIVPVAVIVLRDVGMTAIRFMSPDGEGVRVSSLAKWKTALELFVVGAFLIAMAALFQIIASDTDVTWVYNATPILTGIAYLWIALLVITAALSAYTAWQYLRPQR